MNDKVKPFNEVCTICHDLQKHGKKVVFVHGFFDILHRGHVTLLIEAKKLGDILVVGIDHDENAKLMKGMKRPINDQESRMFILSNITSIDYVFLIPSVKNVKKDDWNLFWGKNIYGNLKPDIVASAMKAGLYGDRKRNNAESVGAKFVDIDHGFYDKSTTSIAKAFGLE
jgi:rfaE bifunctional protein nucleotidyltransferase chain/domain